MTTACGVCGGDGAFSPRRPCLDHGYSMCPFCRELCSCEAGEVRRTECSGDGRQMTLDDAVRAKRDGISLAHAGFANFADSLPYDGEAAE